MIITLLTWFLLYVFMKKAFVEIKKILLIYEATGLGRVKRLWFFNILYIGRKTFIDWAVIYVLLISLGK